MVVKLTMQIKNANSIIANYLLFYFIFTGMSALINSIMSFFNFVDTNLNNLVTGTVYFFLCLGFINLEIFNIEVFYEGLTKAKNKKIVLVVIIGVSIFSGYIFKDMLFSSISEEKMIFGLLLLLIAMMIYGQLTNNSLQLFKYFKKQKIKFKTRGFFSLMLSGFFLILGFFAILVYQLTKDPSESTDNWMNWLSMFLVLGGYIFLYLGFLNTSRK